MQEIVFSSMCVCVYVPLLFDVWVCVCASMCLPSHLVIKSKNVLILLFMFEEEEEKEGEDGVENGKRSD